AEEVVAMQLRKGDDVRKGAVFVGRNENGGRRWTTTCTVTDADPGRVFAFDVRSGIIPISRWQYGIVATEHGCRVTESTWDRRPSWFRAVARMATGVKDRASVNTEHIRRTLQRLKDRAEAG
ncbi:SRPBCC family protein, partial [Mycobacterium tuberculosis]